MTKAEKRYVHEKRFSQYDMVVFGGLMAKEALKRLSGEELHPSNVAALTTIVEMELVLYERARDKMLAEAMRRLHEAAKS